MTCISFEAVDLEQADQLWQVTWDGDLISKASRDLLVSAGKAQVGHGYSWLAADGVLMVQQIRTLRGLGEQSTESRPPLTRAEIKRRIEVDPVKAADLWALREMEFGKLRETHDTQCSAVARDFLDVRSKLAELRSKK